MYRIAGTAMKLCGSAALLRMLAITSRDVVVKTGVLRKDRCVKNWSCV